MSRLGGRVGFRLWHACADTSARDTPQISASRAGRGTAGKSLSVQDSSSPRVRSGVPLRGSEQMWMMQRLIRTSSPARMSPQNWHHQRGTPATENGQLVAHHSRGRRQLKAQPACPAYNGNIACTAAQRGHPRYPRTAKRLRCEPGAARTRGWARAKQLNGCDAAVAEIEPDLSADPISHGPSGARIPFRRHHHTTRWYVPRPSPSPSGSSSADTARTGSTTIPGHPDAPRGRERGRQDRAASPPMYACLPSPLRTAC